MSHYPERVIGLSLVLFVLAAWAAQSMTPLPFVLFGSAMTLLAQLTPKRRR